MALTLDRRNYHGYHRRSAPGRGSDVWDYVPIPCGARPEWRESLAAMERRFLGASSTRSDARWVHAGWIVGTAGVALLLSNPAAAHMGTGLPGGFLSGFKHPFSGIDHLLAIVWVG